MKTPKKQSKKASGVRAAGSNSKLADPKKKSRFEDEDDDFDEPLDDFEDLDDFGNYDDDDDY